MPGILLKVLLQSKHACEDAIKGFHQGIGLALLSDMVPLNSEEFSEH